MITIRRQTLELSDKGILFLTHLKLDCERATFRIGDFYTARKFNIEIDKPWLGEIKENRFRIIRTKLGLFKSNYSQVMIKGELINDKNDILKLEIGIPGYTIFNFSWQTGFPILFIALATQDTFWSILVGTVILVVGVITITIDLNNTDNKFTDYLERVESNEPQQKI